MVCVCVFAHVCHNVLVTIRTIWEFFSSYVALEIKCRSYVRWILLFKCSVIYCVFFKIKFYYFVCLYDVCAMACKEVRGQL